MQEPYFSTRLTTRFCILYARCKITHLFYYAQTFVLIFCHNMNLQSLSCALTQPRLQLSFGHNGTMAQNISRFCHMHNLLRIGYVDALAVEHVVQLLLALLEHRPIVICLDPYTHHKVDTAVCQSLYAHKRLMRFGLLKYARICCK